MNINNLISTNSVDKQPSPAPAPQISCHDSASFSHHNHHHQNRRQSYPPIISPTQGCCRPQEHFIFPPSHSHSSQPMLQTSMEPIPNNATILRQQSPQSPPSPSQLDLHLSQSVKMPPTHTPTNRRIAHILSEQKRRENINSGFEELKSIVPSCRGCADSKAVILRKAVHYIQMLESQIQKSKHSSDLTTPPSLVSPAMSVKSMSSSNPNDPAHLTSLPPLSHCNDNVGENSAYEASSFNRRIVEESKPHQQKLLGQYSDGNKQSKPSQPIYHQPHHHSQYFNPQQFKQQHSNGYESSKQHQPYHRGYYQQQHHHHPYHMDSRIVLKHENYRQR
ncbi:14235_t:CDS:2 [Acaulospora morrowiae]|uniref:14235_t:CDS:1 n=1 Tax=Acaulospora morrowiae TaxID=94023 RepID=A0A9N9F830_9GLOM|nr:14235_t:CDS:2 [Acaulospora morrowiae]